MLRPGVKRSRKLAVRRGAPRTMGRVLACDPPWRWYARVCYRVHRASAQVQRRSARFPSPCFSLLSSPPSPPPLRLAHPCVEGPPSNQSGGSSEGRGLRPETASRESTQALNLPTAATPSRAPRLTTASLKRALVFLLAHPGPIHPEPPPPIQAPVPYACGCPHHRAPSAPPHNGACHTTAPFQSSTIPMVCSTIAGVLPRDLCSRPPRHGRSHTDLVPRLISAPPPASPFPSTADPYDRVRRCWE